MTLRLAKLKNLLSNGSFTNGFTSGNDEITQPQLGFNVQFCESNKEIRVKVLGARLLPTNFGNTKPEGYFIKVKLFPGKEKFETNCVREAWPIFGESFTFHTHSNYSKIKEQLLGKFLVLTVYVNFKKETKEQTFQRNGSLRRWFSRKDELTQTNERRCSFRENSFNNRRTLGVVTYNLEGKNFTQKKQDVFSTPDIWREIQSISSGFQSESTKGNKKGELQLELTYSKSEDGNNDLLQLTLSRLRCSMKTMQEHEKLKGHLYLKMYGVEKNEKISKWKSDRFEPTISMKIEPKTALLQTYVKHYTINSVKLVIELLNKNILGKKVILGRITIEKGNEMWEEAVRNPAISIQKMICFE